MTFREALQAEIDRQGLSVADIADRSNVSKGAIYNILNGTTEDGRIRPGTRKALAEACSREVVPDAGGVRFVPAGGDPSVPAEPVGVRETADAVVLTWMMNRPFLADRHASEAFDWLHRMEEEGRLARLDLVDRVYQNRPEFLSLMIHNKGASAVDDLRVGLKVAYEASRLTHAFTARVPVSIQPGAFLEETVFVCFGDPYAIDVTAASLSDEDGTHRTPRLPETLAFAGGRID